MSGFDSHGQPWRSWAHSTTIPEAYALDELKEVHAKKLKHQAHVTTKEETGTKRNKSRWRWGIDSILGELCGMKGDIQGVSN